MDTYTLSYVNTADNTIDLDREFADPFTLYEFVQMEHPDYTSYQVVVTRKAG